MTSTSCTETDGYYRPGSCRTHRGGHRSKHDVEQTKTTTEPNGAEYNCEMLHSSVLRYVGRVDYMDGFAFDFVGVSGSGCNFDGIAPESKRNHNRSFIRLRCADC